MDNSAYWASSNGTSQPGQNATKELPRILPKISSLIENETGTNSDQHTSQEVPTFSFSSPQSSLFPNPVVLPAVEISPRPEFQPPGLLNNWIPQYQEPESLQRTAQSMKQQFERQVVHLSTNTGVAIRSPETGGGGGSGARQESIISGVLAAQKGPQEDRYIGSVRIEPHKQHHKQQAHIVTVDNDVPQRLEYRLPEEVNSRQLLEPQMPEAQNPTPPVFQNTGENNNFSLINSGPTEKKKPLTTPQTYKFRSPTGVSMTAPTSDSTQATTPSVQQTFPASIPSNSPIEPQVSTTSGAEIQSPAMEERSVSEEVEQPVPIQSPNTEPIAVVSEKSISQDINNRSSTQTHMPKKRKLQAKFNTNVKKRILSILGDPSFWDLVSATSLPTEKKN